MLPDKQVVILSFLFASFFCLSPSAAIAAEKKASPPERIVVATYGDEEITLEDLDLFISELPENIQAIAQFRKAEILDSMISRRMMFEYAKSKKYGDRKAVKDYVKRARREIMIQVAVQEVEKSSKPTEKELRAEYQKNKQKFKQEGKVTASHIMVATEKEAKDLISKLEKGSKFEELAKQYSLAPERANGGSLGEMTRGHHKTTGLPEVIEQTAFSLKPGTYSGAVKSEYGWHVIYTSAKDEARQLSFDEVRTTLEKELSGNMRTKALDKLISKLKRDHKVKKFPERIK